MTGPVELAQDMVRNSLFSLYKSNKGRARASSLRARLGLARLRLLVRKSGLFWTFLGLAGQVDEQPEFFLSFNGPRKYIFSSFFFFFFLFL